GAAIGTFRPRQRDRFRHAARGQALRGFPAVALLDRFRRHRHWPGQCAAHYPASQWPNLGRSKPRAWGDVLFFVAPASARRGAAQERLENLVAAEITRRSLLLIAWRDRP